MKIKSTILSTILVALFAMTSVAYAESKGGCHDGGGSGGGMGDNTRERGDPSSRGQGELNHDNDTQGAEISSQNQRTGGHSLGSISKGEPRDPGYSYNRTRQETMSHD
jgi:hypothetical protein